MGLALEVGKKAPHRAGGREGGSAPAAGRAADREGVGAGYSASGFRVFSAVRAGEWGPVILPEGSM